MPWPEFDIIWKPPPTQQYVDWLTRGFDHKTTFPYEDWILSVDGVPIEEVDSTTKLKMLPQVYHFLAVMQDTHEKYLSQPTSDDGNSG